MAQSRRMARFDGKSKTFFSWEDGPVRIASDLHGNWFEGNDRIMRAAYRRFFCIHDLSPAMFILKDVATV